jgi:hypothetical protein
MDCLSLAGNHDPAPINPCTMKRTRVFIITILLMLFPFLVSSQEAGPAASFLASGNAYATMFFDYYYVLKGDNLYPGRSIYAKNNARDNAFSFRRVYFGYDHTFSDTFSGRVQLELSDWSTLPNGSRGFFLKDASLRWKNIFPLSDLHIGQIATPVWSTSGSEAMWRYRSIERTIADLRGLRSSSDSGVRLTGQFTGDGRFGYNFMIGNGTGTRPESDKYKVVYMNLWTRLLDKRLYLEVFQDYNKASDDRHIATTKGLLIWTKPAYTLGLEMVHQVKGGFGAEHQDINISGISIFAHADIASGKLRAFGRYDSFDPDVHFARDHYAAEALPPYDEHFLVFGLDFIPLRNIHLMPNVMINAYNAKTPEQPGPETEVVARLTLNVNFR